MVKRSAIDAFFSPKAKAIKKEVPSEYETHASYPIPLPSKLPFEIEVRKEHKVLNHLPDLDCLHFTPLIPQSQANALFEFIRDEICWYRVNYTVRGINIHTPRYTSLFGLDSTHQFSSSGIIESTSRAPPKKSLRCVPRPIPGFLRALKEKIEDCVGEEFNFILLNYYADGRDSISYHSDDESFLGLNPTIVSISLGSNRDFLMRRKADHKVSWKTTLKSGDAVVMRGTTQGSWDHAIPKRKEAGGRINITFRRNLSRAGTENYYRYNIGEGPYFRFIDGGMIESSLINSMKAEKDNREEEEEDREKLEEGMHGTVKEESFDVLEAVREIERVYGGTTS